MAEVNIMALFKNLERFNEVFEHWGEFLKEIKEQLCKLPGEEAFQLCYELQSPEEPSPSFLSFKLSSLSCRRRWNVGCGQAEASWVSQTASGLSLAFLPASSYLLSFCPSGWLPVSLCLLLPVSL